MTTHEPPQAYARKLADQVEPALEALRRRTAYSAFADSPSPRVYGPDAADAGRAAFEAHQGQVFELDTPGAVGTVATEVSPYAFPMGMAYPRVTPTGLDALLTAARAGLPAWRDAGPDTRLAVCVEILDRLHHRIFELANAVQATTGQGFVMAFQAGGANALDRALESLALAHAEMTRWPATSSWERSDRRGTTRLTSSYTVVPLGIAAVIGCTTFPTWNSYPGLFASLVTGNPVVVKPHPHAVLPLAITVAVCQETLADKGFDPHLVTLAAEEPTDGLARALVTRPEVRIVDFTGSGEFGGWIEDHATQAAVFTEKSGVNQVVVDSTDSFAGMCANLAFTLSLYAGQMCTTSQTLYVPAGGIDTDEGHRGFDEVVARIAGAIDDLLADETRAVELLGAVVDDRVLARLEGAVGLGMLVRASRALRHPAYPQARIRTPALVVVDFEAVEAYGRECFGPVSFLVRTPSTSAALERAGELVTERGAMTFAVHSTSADVLERARATALDSGVSMSENLTDGIYVNQSMAFSDLHGTGLNPAANASYTDTAFVASRFHVVQTRRHDS